MEAVSFSQMHQLTEARCDDDNWTGLKDRAERRRRQTRLNLRAYRKRRAVLKASEDSESTTTPGSGLSRRVAPLHNVIVDMYPELVGQAELVSLLHIPAYFAGGTVFVPARILYPISRDHLLPVVEFNVYRASLTNVTILGLFHLVRASCGFNGPVPVFPNCYKAGDIPDSLRPTALQQTTPHFDWIDLLPSPRMRDNAIRAQHTFTNQELCVDILGGLNGKENGVDSGIRVWSNPWEPEGWELTTGIVKKWGFLVRGCDDMFRASNRWRQLRGEEPVNWEEEIRN
ncbi:hypothetical protein BX600DRAFT_517506 [Xylariales sp. PMI_506]|nr:hypothetical protein BX600DRAFT_517506 [Xylariales sp. PMI_506]